MRLNARIGQTSLARVGMGKEAAFFVIGVIGITSLLRRVRQRQNRAATASRAPAAHRLTQESEPSEASIEWTGNASIVQPASVGPGQLLLLDEILSLTPKQVWKLIYDMAFTQAFYQKRGYREIGIGGWQKTGDQTRGKSAHYITPVKKNVIGPSEAYTEEEYTCQTRGPEGFIVNVCAYTREVPYGKCFHVELVWTAARMSASTTRLQVVGMFVPEKRMLGVGVIIRKATFEGLQESYSLYRQHLLDHLSTNGPGSGQPLAAKGSIAASRTASALSKEAAEDLVRTGVFISWAQLLWTLLLLACMVAATRMALDQGVPANLKKTWRTEWQRASAALFEQRQAFLK